MTVKRLLFSVLLLIVALVIMSGFFLIRHNAAVRASDEAWNNTQVQPLTDFGVTRHLSILPLTDKNAPTGLKGELGVAYLVRTDTITILFDLGLNGYGSGVLLHNMEHLGISEGSMDVVVISHYHPDHIGGMPAMLQNTFSFGGSVDLAGQEVYAPVPLTYPDTTPVVAADPLVIALGVATTGTILFPELFPFLALRDPSAEQSLVVNVEGKGLVVITGCGHPTVQRMLPRTTALATVPVYGIVGGLHLTNASAADLQPTIEFLESYNLSLIAPSPHDSGQVALDALREAFPDAYQGIMVGQEIVVGSDE